MKKKILYISLFLLISLIFIDIVGAETYNNYDSTSAVVSCGNGMIDKIPAMVPKTISIIYNVILVAVPVVLVIMGMLDLMKGIVAQKEDDISKGRKTLIKRLISAALVFFVFIVVKFVVSFVASDSEDANKVNKIMDCAECFINNECTKDEQTVNLKDLLEDIKNRIW